MQRIVTYTRFHGNGNEFILNNILNEELKRQREKERKYITKMEDKNYKLLKEKMDAFRAMVCPRCNKRFIHKVKETLIFIWACIICYAEKLNLIEYEKEWNANENFDS